MKVTFLFRKRLSGFHSIEELFFNISSEVQREYKVENIELFNSGGSPLIILKNLKRFKSKNRGIVHITGDVHYMALVTGKNTILTMHDIGSAYHGTFIRKLYIKLFWFWLPVMFVKKITVISEFTKSELSKFIPFASKKIVVIHNPVNSKLTFSPKVFNETCPQILLIGTKPNKNLERTFKALQSIPCQLHVIGELTKNQKALLNKYNLTFSNMFHVPYKAVVQAYQESDLVLFASTYEGFGMPIIEAQAIGRPVVTSNLGAMKEVAGGSACLVDPFDILSIREGVKRVLNDSEYRNSLIVKGHENVKRFQTDFIAEQYKDLYLSVINENH